MIRASRMFLRLLLMAAVAGLATTSGRAQVTLTTAVDLALRNSPRVRSAEADVNKARAVLAETRDVYIPTVVGGSGLGYSYGFPLGQPTIFNFQSQSLLFSYSQKDYIRAARAGLEGANLALMDVRQAVAEDAALTYLALTRDQDRQLALRQESEVAGRLVSIVNDRLAAGEDTAIGLTTAKLTGAQIHLALLRAEDDAAVDAGHLARLTGLPAEGLTTAPAKLPDVALESESESESAVRISGRGSGRGSEPTSPAVQAAFANARSKLQQAFGDARYVWRPQIAFAAAYSRFSNFNNYQEYYGRHDAAGNSLGFQFNAAAIGVQISLPVVDAVRKARARETAADATHAQQDAEVIRDQFLDGRLRTRRSLVELAARAEVAGLDQQLAQQQLDVLLVQLNQAGTGPNGAPMTPKDEQNARIAERERALGLIDARYQMQQVQINLLRQTGQLETWLKSAARMP